MLLPVLSDRINKTTASQTNSRGREDVHYHCRRRIKTTMNIHALLVSMMIMSITARELRPSDHGLEYQSTPPKGEELPPEMEDFFGTSATSPPTSRSSSGVALPKAMTSNDTAWWNGVNRSRNNGGDRLRHVLLVASIACGVTGLALLVSSGFVYFLKYEKRKSSELVHNNNCKAIVVSNTVKS